MLKGQSSNHWPSDEQPQLASQAEDMASLLETDSPVSGLSEKLHKFAKDVAVLESRASEAQVKIFFFSENLIRKANFSYSSKSCNLFKEHSKFSPNVYMTWNIFVC